MPVDMSDLVLQLEDMGTEAFVEAQQEMIDVLIEVTPEGETGVLRESYRATVTAAGGSFVSGTIENIAPYSLFVDEGTQPHPIEGNPVLVFEVGGVQVFTTHVDHPGTPRTGFWSDNVTDQQWSELVQAALEALSR